MEMRGIEPRTSRMQSERSTIWATSPFVSSVVKAIIDAESKRCYFNKLFSLEEKNKFEMHG